MQIVVGTAGHIDHGKTALVKALTGTDTDRLAEEKARGMTIDLGFAYLDPSITIIDVPGHEKFIRNMVAGVSTIHIAMLVIAADDGVMPQTKEHLQILKLLGVRQGIIVLNKIDIPDSKEWIDLVELEIQDLVSDTFLKKAPIIRTSTLNGDGIEGLRSTIFDQSKSTKLDLDRGFFYLPVDRAFSKTGFGSVVTGTVLSGKAKTGSELETIPGNQKVKVRGLHTHGCDTGSVKMGDRAAINLVGCENEKLKRGIVIADLNRIKATQKLIAHAKLISDTKWKLKNHQRIHVHIGTAEVIAKVLLRKPLKAGEFGNIILIFEKPVAAVMDQPFIIRSFSPMETIGGCVVLDSNPKKRIKDLRKWSEELEVETRKRFFQFVSEFWRVPKSLGEWAQKFHIQSSELRKWAKFHNFRIEKGIIFTDKSVQDATFLVRKILNDFHDDNPYKKSLSRDVIKKKSGFNEVWLTFILAYMKEELIIVGGGYALISHSLIIRDNDINLAHEIENLVKKALFTLPNAKTIHPKNEKKGLEILHVLKDQQKVIDVAPGMWLHAKGFNKLKHDLRNYFTNYETMKIADFKALTNTSRKTAIPLLEYCDKIGITERFDDLRKKGKNFD